jgi:triosephosphate isomerase
MRKNIVVGNWKMNLNRDEAVLLVNDVLKLISLENKIEVVFATSFVHLYKVAKICVNKSNVFAASQDCSASKNGAFTGEVSAKMISSCFAKYVILGHSERRVNFSETNKLIKSKVRQAFANKLNVIFCCGESLEQRQSGVHFEWINSQITESLFHLSCDDFSKIVIAYEPIWAIGTGVTASSDQAQEVHSFIRNIITDKYGSKVSQNTSILYGGSCNSKNAIELFSQKDIDGGLIGGASLDATAFVAITNSF